MKNKRATPKIVGLTKFFKNDCWQVQKLMISMNCMYYYGKTMFTFKSFALNSESVLWGPVTLNWLQTSDLSNQIKKGSLNCKKVLCIKMFHFLQLTNCFNLILGQHTSIVVGFLKRLIHDVNKSSVLSLKPGVVADEWNYVNNKTPFLFTGWAWLCLLMIVSSNTSCCASWTENCTFICDLCFTLKWPQFTGHLDI